MNSLLRRRIARLVSRSVHRHLGATSDRLEDIAGDLDVSASYLSNIMHTHNGAGCPADLVVLLTRCLGDHSVIAGLAEACGGLYLVAPEPGAHGTKDGVHAVREATESCAFAVATLLRAMEDGVVTAQEVRNLEDAVPAAILAIGGLLKSAREMQTRGKRMEE